MISKPFVLFVDKINYILNWIVRYVADIAPTVKK